MSLATTALRLDEFTARCAENSSDERDFQYFFNPFEATPSHPHPYLFWIGKPSISADGILSQQNLCDIYVAICDRPNHVTTNRYSILCSTCTDIFSALPPLIRPAVPILFTVSSGHND